MAMSGQAVGGLTQSAVALRLLWLLLALSSFVRFEPAPYDIFGGGLFVLFLILGLRIPGGVRAPAFCLCIFMLANIIAGIFAEDPEHTLRTMFIRLYLILSWLFFVCIICENPRRVYEVIWSGYIVAAIITVLVADLVFMKILELPIDESDKIWDYGGRALGLFKDPNVFGPYLIPVALYSFVNTIDRSGLRAFVMSALFILFGVGILIAFSRGAWLNLGVSFLVWGALRVYTGRGLAQYVKTFAQTGVLLGIASLTVIWAISIDQVGESFEQRARLNLYYDDSRFTHQAELLEAALVTPIGVGPHGTGIVGTKVKIFAPHNVFLHVLIESGWIGAVAFYVFLAMTLWRGWQFCVQPTAIQDVYIIVFACTVGLLTQSLFIDSTHWRHMYLLFGMLWGPLLAWKADRAALLSLRRSGAGFDPP